MFEYSTIQERLLRLLIFILLNFVLIRYVLDVTLDDYSQIKIVAISTLCFMIIDTYYPRVIINK